MRISFFLFLLCLQGGVVRSQSAPLYSFWQDDSIRKKQYYQESLRKKQSLVSALGRENNKDYREAYDNMFEIAEDLLASSRAVTYTRADDYIKAIAGLIIRNNPELRSLDLRIVFSRDYAPNAYSIGDGTIALNAGLFVYLKTEAEIAFVLCHELAHYYLDHSRKKIEKMVYLMNSDSLKKEFKRLAKQQYRIGEQLEKLSRALVFDIKRHSREGEREADRLGLRFLRNSGYSGAGFIRTMETLDQIDDTSLFREPDLRRLFHFPDYPFREKWIRKESALFGAMNTDDASGLSQKERDSLKTHPDCTQRIALLKDSALSIRGKDFQVDESLFRELQEGFVPEMLEEIYKSKNISFNLYLSLQLLQEGRFVPLAVYSIARDLNLLYQYQKNHQLGLVVDSESRYLREGYNLLLRMLYRLRLQEIAELTDRFCAFYQDRMNGVENFREAWLEARRNLQTHN